MALAALVVGALAVAPVAPVSAGPHPPGPHSPGARAAGLQPAAPAAPESAGRWGEPFAWPVLPIHATVLPDGRVLGFGAEPDGRATGAFSYAVWDPSRGDTAEAVTALPNTTGADFFCSTQILVPATGDVLISGGDTTGMPGMDHGEGAHGTATNEGNQTSSMFRPDGDTVEPGPALTAKRWYATSTTLPDGRVLLQGGADRNGGTGVPTPEVYDPATGTWTPLRGIVDPDAYGTGEQRWWYPRAFVAPSGRVITIAGSLITEIDPAGEGSLRRVGTMPGTNIGATSTAVMFRPGLVLQVGGGAFFNGDDRPASNEATVIDLRSDPPVITPVAPMPTARHWATATVLPTGDVLVTGGTPRNNTAEGATTAPELWDPDTGTWRTLTPEAVPRLYHSVAALLPDGRVLSAAGGSPGPVFGIESQTFSPPYLFVEGAPARRPVVSGAPETLALGEAFALDVDAGSAVSEVALVKTSAVTHSFNNEQRYVPLPFEQDGATVTASPPADPHDLPPGWYQLFVVDEAGVPSVASVVHVPA